MILERQKLFFNYSGLSKSTANAVKASRDNLARDIMAQRRAAIKANSTDNFLSLQRNKEVLKRAKEGSFLNKLGFGRLKEGHHFAPGGGWGSVKEETSRIKVKDLKKLMKKQANEVNSGRMNSWDRDIIRGRLESGKEIINKRYGLR